MRAIDRFYEEQRTNVNWINIAMGEQIGGICPSDYDVKEETLKAQLRADGFKTKKFGEEILFAKRSFKYYS